MILSIKKYKLFILSAILIGSSMSCEDHLEEVPFDQLAPSNILRTEEGLQSLLISAYGNMQVHRFALVRMHYLEEGPSDLFLETGGGQARHAASIQDFTFDSEHPWIRGVYNNLWNSIRDVNLFLEHVESVEFSKTDKEVSIGEARFIRALHYYFLSKWYGEVPLITSSSSELYPEKSSMAVLNEFIETEFIEAAEALPPVQDEYGRATKGAALAILTKFYLNTKQWQKTADAAQEVMDLQLYSLYPDYAEMFAPENEVNNEFIFVFPQTSAANRMGTTWMSLSLPPGYPIDGPNFAAQFRYYDNFVNTFDPNDERGDMILTEYEKANGTHVQLLGNDNSRSLKFFDANRVGADQENDFPVVRYADILLSRAEALNELNGPTQEAIDLINEVRTRAGDNLELLNLSGFTKETLRDHILAERGWEFYSEIKRRSDLIRHGKFVDRAVARGKSAKQHHVLYPLPQTEINANENLVQNQGY